MSWKEKKVDYVGFRHGNPKESVNPRQANKAFGISSEERTHMAIFGLPGSGKSSIIKLLAYQNIERGQGFMVLDPHGELARDIMSMIPRGRHEDVIYVNPASLYRWGKTLQINPLEVKNDEERYVVVMAFVGALKNLYKDTWGPRLETVLRNAANALVESRGNNTLRNMSALITDEHARDDLLGDVSSREVKHFWEEIFAKQYSKDAGSSAYNKLDKILATPTVAAMLDATESSITISDVIENNRMLIVDLSTGASDDIAEFLGSIFLNMLYVEAKKRIDIKNDDPSEMRKNPFYVYVDEAHMFSNSTMSEMLRALRKFGIKVTIATQTCNAFDKDFAGEIPGTCKTIITGRCDLNTAQLIRSLMSISVEDMQRLSSHTFAMHTDEHGISANGIFQSRAVPFEGKRISDWQDVAKTSVERWGREVAIEKYIPREGAEKIMFSPLECVIIHLLYFDERDWFRDQIFEDVLAVFPNVKERDMSGALDRLTRAHYVKIRYPKADDGDQHEGKKRYIVGEKARRTYLSRAAGGRRAGGEDHIDIIFALADANMAKHRYCVPDLGDRGEDAPDLLIVEPATIQDKNGLELYDPFEWNTATMLAVEVETNPKKHMDQAVKNYEKNIQRDRNVWFICYADEHREALESAIREKYPTFDRCWMDVINHVKVLQKKTPMPTTCDELLSNLKVKSITHLIQKPVIDEPAKTPHQLDSLKEYNHTSKKNDGEIINKNTGQRVFNAAATGEKQSSKEEPSNTEKHQQSPHLHDLEEMIFSLAENAGIEYDYTKIYELVKRSYPQMACSKSMVGDAVRNLLYKKALVQTHMTKYSKRGSLDGTGDRRASKSIKYLVRPDEVAPDFKSDEISDTAVRASKEQKERKAAVIMERQIVADDIRIEDLTDARLEAMLADVNMKEHHEQARKELEKRMG